MPLREGAKGGKTHQNSEAGGLCIDVSCAAGAVCVVYLALAATCFTSLLMSL